MSTDKPKPLTPADYDEIRDEARRFRRALDERTRDMEGTLLPPHLLQPARDESAPSVDVADRDGSAQTTDRLSVALAWCEEAGFGVPAFKDADGDEVWLEREDEYLVPIDGGGGGGGGGAGALCFRPPFTRLPLATPKPPWRSGREAMHWALDNPGRELEDVSGERYRFYRGEFQLKWGNTGWEPVASWGEDKRPAKGGW